MKFGMIYVQVVRQRREISLDWQKMDEFLWIDV
jgi:hypothetical protein